MVDAPLPWHQHAWQQVQRGRAGGRLPHALLLTGAAGLGKLAFAHRLARALLCEEPVLGGDACGQCQRCHLAKTGSHPDLSVIQPEDDQKSLEGDSLSAASTKTRTKKKKSKVIKIEQVRDVCTFLGYTPHYGGYKIALLEPADRLNSNAANSLLKTLEEPPGDSVLILVTAHPARLPATVRSRCQIIRFKTPAPAQVLPWLSSRLPAGLEPHTVLQVAGGAPLSALRYADGERWQRRRQWVESYDQVLTGQRDPVRAAEDWLNEDLSEHLQWLIGWHTDLIRLKMDSNPPCLDHPDVQGLLRRWAAQSSPQRLFERLEAAIQLYTLCSTTQVNAQLLLEVFLGGGAEKGQSSVSRISVTEG